MRIIGVIDLRHGRAVHARAGVRERYAPVHLPAPAHGEPGNPHALARFYTETLGIQEIYVADLDAIVDNRPQTSLISTLAAAGPPLWLDAGIGSVDEARLAVELGASRVIVGLETLPSFSALREICRGVGVAFSLDLRDSAPLVRAGGKIPPGESAETLARHAHEAGADTMIVIDLARVGTGAGVDLGLIARLRALLPDVTLIAGGGIRGWNDVELLSDAGCDGALVATALQNGSLTDADVARTLYLAPRL